MSDGISRKAQAPIPEDLKDRYVSAWSILRAVLRGDGYPVRVYTPQEELADIERIAALTAERTLARGLLETIQQALVNQHWQTLGDVYRGKTLFLSQDLLNKIDTALDGDAQ